ncbi:ABC transporter permease [Botrimarina mediterranea]|uniref:Macrolide export ATP-binding/permease protein MacB n=1 Tax=Botrimarina mediterranea TaxID=2528022 RepID=A0A518K7C5_9BACT|nr:ABC transporter permease [Botrimarina mediterranea]QDV73696.1 Macrolide export ATP-binding/permease protein MacB [Botrimarina mediterranea]QDV78286.1 Macrolide export ATP-binding/permease protein MacB [Planctomycetes bacterium K2D]
MFRFVPYVLKSLWRHRARTLLTVSGTTVALLVFCFIGSVQQGLLALTNDASADRTLIVFQENRFCPQSSRLPQDYSDVIAKTPGVREVVPIKVFTNNCRASLDAIVFQGMPPEKLSTARDLSLASGSMLEFTQQDDGALVGADVAARRGLAEGDKFTIGDVSVVVKGVFRSSVAAENNLIYTHLEFLQRARGANDVGTVTQLEVHLTDGIDPDETAAKIDQAFRSGPVSTTTRTKGMFQADTLGDLAELIGFVHWLGYACVGLVLSLVATTTVMSVQDRIKEHAVLQTLGLRPLRVFRLVLIESVVLSTLGGVLGVAGSVLVLSSTGMSVAAEGVTIAFEPSATLAVQGVAVSIVVGILAGFAPGWHAARAEIVPALRQA